MKVTLTLSDRAMEFVNGIPEDEIPNILSDLLNRTLESQIDPLTSTEETIHTSQSVDSTSVLDLLREILSKIDKNGIHDSDKKILKEVVPKIKEQVSSNVDLEDDDMFEEFSALMK